MSKDLDQYYMQRALSLAARGLGRTAPNPCVGAVIVKDGKIIGEGYHQKAGTSHAEIHALREAGSDARGATIYVTLEPCNHFGRTPPCTEALIKAGVERAVIATTDLNPRVAGQGCRKLREAGIEIECGLMGQEAHRLNEFFFKHVQTGTPFVAVKTAMTLDGKIASFSGDSRWISGEASRRQVHQLRNTYDAIMVGIGTVLKDNPRLNTRLELEGQRDPVRVIVDSYLDLPLDSRIVKSCREQPTIVFCLRQASSTKIDQLESAGVEVIPLDGEGNLVPIQQILSILGQKGISSLLVEGGGEINGFLFKNQLVDKVFWFIAPKIAGGKAAPSPVGGTGVEFIKDAWELKSLEVSRCGVDIMVTGYLHQW